MTKNKAYVYILILNYNSSKDSVELYDQLQHIDYKNHFILIIDNKSTDNSINVLKKHIPMENLILNKKNLGYASGNNIGIRKAIKDKADYVWIINPDIRVENNTLNILLNNIAKNNKIAAIGPRICDRRNKNIIFSDGGILDIKNGFKTGHLNNGKEINNINESVRFKEIDYVDGSCFLMNLSCAEQIGLLREDFFMYFEETEWCIRARNQGWKLLVVNGTRCFHLPSNKGFKYFYYMTRNRIYLSIIMKKHVFKTACFEVNLIVDSLLKMHFKKTVFKIIGLIGVLLKAPLVMHVLLKIKLRLSPSRT